jgi:16S rRNA (uracil1498-N3)-methyltransferase
LTIENYTKLLRLYVPEHGFNVDKKCSLSEGQAHYLRNVMRKSAGDTLRLFNGEDGDWLATLEEINKKNAVVKLNHQLLEQKNSPDIWVLASPVKKEAFDMMIEKACELGAARFIPVICERTVVHKINQERLQAISTEAAEQCERMDVMEVAPLGSLEKSIESATLNRNLIFCLERADGTKGLRQTLESLPANPIAVLIGPEGGFSDQEINLICKINNVYPVSLGSRILRAETALISALAGIQLLAE